MLLERLYKIKFSRFIKIKKKNSKPDRPINPLRSFDLEN